MNEAPSIDAIIALRDDLRNYICRTPIMRCVELEDSVGNNTRITGKLEFMQRTGTFKVRGALAAVMALSAEQVARGVTAVSAGNHAIATAYAAKSVGAEARIVMLKSANPCRVAACAKLDAEIILVDDVHAAFDLARQIEEEEGRYFLHPYDGADIATGTGTVGLEIHEQVADFDTVLVAIGGGGLIGGLANALKLLRPDCEIIGVEPEGADSMHRSFVAGEAQSIDRVATIADSLGAPAATPYSYFLCRQNVDQLVTVSDEQIRRAMGFLFQRMNIAVEPACAATTAALLGPLQDRLRGKRTVLVFCGSNIDWQTFESQAIFPDEYAA